MRKFKVIKLKKFHKRCIAFVLVAAMSLPLLGNINIVRANDALDENAAMLLDQVETDAAVQGADTAAEPESQAAAQQSQPADSADRMEQPEPVDPADKTETPEQSQPSEAPENAQTTETTEDTQSTEATENTQTTGAPQTQPDGNSLPMEELTPAESAAPVEPNAPAETIKPAEEVVPMAPLVAAAPQAAEPPEMPEIFDMSDMEDRVLYNSKGQYTTSIDLQSMYNIQGMYGNGNGSPMAYYPGNGGDMPNKGAPAPYVVGPNHYLLGVSYNAPGPKQVISSTSKFSLNFQRPFVIEGSIKLPNGSDGFAVAFHPAQNFELRNAGGSMGVYRHPTNTNANRDGLWNATIMEVDTYHNGDALDAYAEPSGGRHHISIIETMAQGSVDTTGKRFNQRAGLRAAQNVTIYFEQEIPIRIVWNPYAANNNLQFSYGQNTISVNCNANDAPRLYNLREDKNQKGRGHVTFSSSVNMAASATATKFTVTRMEYTDLRPTMELKVHKHNAPLTQVNTYDDYIVPGYAFTLENHLYNELSSPNINDHVYLDKLVTDTGWRGREQELMPGGRPSTGKIQYWADGGWSSSLTSDAFPALDADFRTRGGNDAPGRIRYTLQAPDNGNLSPGDRSKFHYKFKSGVWGMSQVEHEGSVTVRTQNGITANDKSGIVFQQVDDVSKITKDLLWQNIKVKSSGKDGNTFQTITDRTGRIQDMQITYEYFMHGKKTGTNFDFGSDGVQRGRFYGLKVTITDNNGDERLTNSVLKVVYAGDVYSNNGNMHIVASHSKKPISTTNLTKMSDNELYTHFVNNTYPGAAIVTMDGISPQTTYISINAYDAPWVQGRDVIPKPAGTYDIVINVGNNPAGHVEVRPTQEITEIIAGYEDENPPYIVIPRVIQLEKRGNKLAGDAYVRFVNTTSTRSYHVSVNGTTVMTGKKNPDNTFNLTVEGNPNTVPDDPSRVVITGALRKEHNYVPFTLVSDPSALQTTSVEDTWFGTLTYTFKQN